MSNLATNCDLILLLCLRDLLHGFLLGWFFIFIFLLSNQPIATAFLLTVK
ncbi:hypothetical protein HanXRQr2_Chr10g0458561 [Helianthus annuus]|uniref:Uncharacterized protein n=1 Tax=Helianthus annuus TaxID=4232 RepID=A0A9K3I0Z2_HELAN|nr:hypothetical protein HanXRQr2_Chr10g0458561 [Helianthus annuus]